MPDRASPVAAKGAAALLVVAAGIHLLLSPEHFEEHVLFGLFFLGAAAVQVALAGALLLRPAPWAFRVGVLSSGALIATWLVTRAIAPPFADAPEPVTFAGVLAGAVELSTLLLLAVALPLGGGSLREPRFSVRWAAAAGPAFVLLFLVATGALARVETDLSERVAVPSLLLDTYGGWSFQRPWVTAVLSDHLLFGTSWAVAVFLVVAAILVSLNAGLIVGLARCGAACRPQSGGVVAAAPAFVAAPTCCGAGLPVGFALGGGTIVPVVSATPWLLLGTACLLSANLVVLRRRWRVARRLSIL